MLPTTEQIKKAVFYASTNPDELTEILVTICDKLKSLEAQEVSQS